MAEHIETAVISRRSGTTYGRMYAMHKYWSKKSPDVIAKYIRHFTEKEDIVLDPFVGCGITAGEAIKLGRKTIGIDLNPMATFITEMTLTPVTLPHLQWAFEDIQVACEEEISELFKTICVRCGKSATIDFVIRENDTATQIGYGCNCSRQRLFKEPDGEDRRLDSHIEDMKIPFWYPENVQLPFIQKERFEYVHELFTKRNLIALSTIFHYIERLEDEKARNILRLAFTAALDKCSRLKPLSRSKYRPSYSLSEGWVAVRFYAPRLWQEVNPWKAFTRSFERVYEGKKESNVMLPNIAIGSSYDELRSGSANVIILTGSADEVMREQLPKESVDYVLTDPPFGSSIQYLPLSTFWGAWLGFDFDYARELVVAPKRGKTLAEYHRKLRLVFEMLSRVSKRNSYVHIFCHDISGPYMHSMLNSLGQVGIMPERVIHQPPPNTFGAAVRKPNVRKGHTGSYIIGAKVWNGGTSLQCDVPNDSIREKVAKTARTSLEIRNGSAPVARVLHSVYHQLQGNEILAFAKNSAEDFLRQSISEFARIKRGEVELLESGEAANGQIKNIVRDAVLDAHSVLVGDVDKKNIVQQLVLRRLQGKITPDDIRDMEITVSRDEAFKRREERFTDLLLQFGKKLGFQCSTHSSSGTCVLWTRPGKLECSFQLVKKDIQVLASQLTPTQNSVSELGKVSYINLEAKLLEWCRKNPEQRSDIIHRLNPLEEPLYTLPSWQASRTNGPKHLQLKVLKNKEVGPDHYIMQLQMPTGSKWEPLPGQFFHVACDSDGGESRDYPLTLRRPFSTHAVQYHNFNRSLLAKAGDIPSEIREILERTPSSIDFLYKVVGEGTEALAQINPEVKQGVLLDMRGPIGNGFTTTGPEHVAVIVGGGVGIAPLIALAERLRYLDKEVYVYLGAVRQASLLPALIRPDSTVELGFANGMQELCALLRKESQEIGAHEPRICTETEGDIVGEKGLVTDILERDIMSNRLPTTDVCFYACGPWGMLRAVSDIARRYSVKCEVLLEERMSCGIGDCLSCAINTKNGVKRVCRDGPVFNSSEIVWID